jgi:hypothetical protein
MHISKLFTIMYDKKHYFLSEKFKKEDFTRFRKVIILSILATDNARHFGDVAKA